MGYFKAKAQQTNPEPTSAPPGEITIALNAGQQFHAGHTTLHGNHVMAAHKLQGDLAIHPGDLFRISLIDQTLENLRLTYGRAGYINEVASPGLNTDERTHVIDLDLQIEEGRPFTLGALSVVGNEPRSGATGTLIESWKELKGQLFNPDTLEEWLGEHRAECPGCTLPRDLTFTQNSTEDRVDVKLILPQPIRPL